MKEILIDAFKDSIALVPFLFLIFLILEVFEKYFSDKIFKITRFCTKSGPLLGSTAAAIPQCWLSVIAATLYVKKYITKGTLIAIFISTSDEAVPVLLANPDKVSVVLPLVITKIIIGICAGYLIDFVSKEPLKHDCAEFEIEEKGCCHHEISTHDKKLLLIHPLKHTLNIFVFIFFVTLFLNFLVAKAGDNLSAIFLQNSILQPLAASVIGLIPNCAISVLITMLYIKGVISFGSVIAGLSAGAGLGLIVLFKKNSNLKDTLNIIFILIAISTICGIAMNLLNL